MTLARSSARDGFKILFLVIITFFLIPGVNALTETIYVNEFTDEYEDWSVQGSLPYLHDTDADYIYVATNNYLEGHFRFPDWSLGPATIESVVIYFETYQAGSGETFSVHVFDGISTTNEGSISPDGSYSWKSLNISSKIADTGEIDDCRFYVQYHKSGASSNVYIRRAYLNITYELTESITQLSGDSTPQQFDDLEQVEFNITIEIAQNTENFSRNILTIDRTGAVGDLFINITYLNGTGFSELDDPNNFLFLDVGACYKQDHNTGNLSLIYIFYFFPNITDDGWFSTESFSNLTTPGLNDTDVGGIDSIQLNIRNPDPPSLVFGAGFNASSPYIEIYWTGGTLADDYEGQNSTDGSSWSGLFNQTELFYNDTSPELTNGTYRFYQLRSNRVTGVGNKTSSWVSNNERVHFIRPGGGGAPEVADEFDFFFLILGISFMVVSIPLTKVWIEENN